MDNEVSQETNTNDTTAQQPVDNVVPEEEKEKHPGGRPLKFKTKEELQEKIDEYFESCFEEKWFDEEERDENGNRMLDDNGHFKKGSVKKKFQVRPFTITGLADHLDTSRKVLCEYEEKDEFSNAIKKAKLKCENYAEESLFTKNQVTGTIFNLKNNYGWKDKTEQEMTVKLPKPLLSNVQRNNSTNEDIGSQEED